MAIHVFIRGSSMRKAYFFGSNKVKLTKNGWGINRWNKQLPPGTRYVAYSEQTNNNCPYIWNKYFWATYCNLPKKSICIGDTIIYVIKHTNKGKKSFLCDLIFEVEDTFIWPSCNWNSNFAIRNSKATPPIIAQRASTGKPIYGYMSKKVNTDFVVYDHLSRSALSHPRNSYISYIAHADNSYQPQINYKLINLTRILSCYNIMKTQSPSQLPKIPKALTNNKVNKVRGNVFHMLMCNNRLIL